MSLSSPWVIAMTRPVPRQNPVRTAMLALIDNPVAWSKRSVKRGWKREDGSSALVADMIVVPNLSRKVNGIINNMLLVEDPNNFDYAYCEPNFGPVGSDEQNLAEYRLLGIWLLNSLETPFIGEVQNAVIRRLGVLAEALKFDYGTYEKRIDNPSEGLDFAKAIAHAVRNVRMDVVLYSGLRNTEPAWLKVHLLTFTPCTGYATAV